MMVRIRKISREQKKKKIIFNSNIRPGNLNVENTLYYVYNHTGGINFVVLILSAINNDNQIRFIIESLIRIDILFTDFCRLTCPWLSTDYVMLRISITA